MSKTIRLIQIDGDRAHIKKVSNDLESIKALIGGGYLEQFSLGNGFVGLCDEDGRMKGFPINTLGIAGVLVISKYYKGNDATQYGELDSLTDDDIDLIASSITKKGIYFPG
ncbi:hypothetical protein [Bacillus sp. NPDC094106]|uniref:DUF3846 domain-containing protein n=1 Tax=Bacillus sp. NPDC094106 TaxID=3363949 RepID=UPI00382B0CDE